MAVTLVLIMFSPWRFLAPQGSCHPIMQLIQSPIDQWYDSVVYCERSDEVAIGVFDLAPTGFISRCPWSRTGFVRSSAPNISSTKLDSFLCSASWLRVTLELSFFFVLCSFFVRLLTVWHFACTKWFCQHQLQCLIAKKKRARVQVIKSQIVSEWSQQGSGGSHFNHIGDVFQILCLMRRNTFRVVCLLDAMNIIFQGQHECLGKYGDTGHLSFCFLFALTFSGGCCFTAVFCICSMYGGNSLLDAQTQEPAAANHFFEQNEMFNSWLDSISILLLQALGLRELESVWNRWTRDMQMFYVVWEQVCEVSVVKF